MTRQYLLVLSLLWTAACSTAQEEEEEQTCEWVENANVCISAAHPQCGLWMAPSTLGEGANLGMYAGQTIPANFTIQEEMVIPLLFRDFDDTLYWNQVDGASTDKDDGVLWHRYIWNGWVADIETYDIYNIRDIRAVFVPGIGCTINSILEMRNVESTHGSVYDTAGVPRSHPNAGAFTPYHKSVTKSVVEIPAGGEIFADYVSQNTVYMGYGAVLCLLFYPHKTQFNSIIL